MSDTGDATFTINCAPPFLTACFAAPQRTLGWSLLYPGFAVVTDVVWVEVRNSDLGPSVDPCAFLRTRLARSGLPGPHHPGSRPGLGAKR